MLGAVCSALAQEIQTVNITDTGPDRPVPLGSSFNLAGAAKATTKSVQAVIVRTGTPFLFNVSDPSCSVLATGLNTAAPADKPIPAGRTTAGVAFPNASRYQDNEAFASAAWTRGEASGEQPFKLLVSADTDFFRAGYVYCLFLIEGKALVDDERIASALETLGREKTACRARKARAPAPGGEKKGEPVQHCETDAEKKYDEAVARAFGGVASDVAKKTREAATREVGTAMDFYSGREVVAKRVRFFAKPEPLGQPARWRRINGTDGDGLAIFVANRLTVTPGGLLPQAVPTGTGTTSSYLAKYTTDGAYEVEQLQVLDDGLQIRVAPATISDKPAPKMLAAKTSDVHLGPNATLRDLLLLVDDRVQIGAELLSLSDVQREIGNLTLAMPARNLQRLADLSAKLTAIQDALGKVKRTAEKTDESSTDSPSNVAKALLGWLDSRGFQEPELERQSNALNRMVDAKRTWDERKAGLSVKTETVASRTFATETIRFNQKTWVFSYLTPVLGYALISDSFTMFYTGVQLHLVPNPVNDPQWSDGFRDFDRFFAIEVGIAPRTGSFGPDGRYTGIDSLPPIFVGLAMHPIPYTSVTVGKTLLKRRASVLPAEDPRFAMPWYVGFNVQANIPDLVHQLSTPTTTTTAEK